jgi:polysaccharide pyruvyl transferase WcaK-like protein
VSGWADDLPEPILVVGGYGYRNIGDEAILSGLLHALTDRRVSVVSRDPAATRALHGVRAIPVRSAAWELLRHRTLLIGGGGLFGAGMGRLGRLLPLYGLLGVALGRRVVVEAVGIDPDLPPASRRLAAALLRRCRRVTVRDAASASVAAGWGVAAEVVPDLAGAMPAGTADGGAILRAAGVDTRRPVVGLCLTAVDPLLAEAVLRAVARLARCRPDLQLCFVPMSRHPSASAHDDLRLADSLQAECPELVVLRGDLAPADVLAVFGELDAVVAMRYHAMAFAERAGTPLVPVSYAAKCRAWLEARDLRSVEPTATALEHAVSTLLPAARMAS